MTLFELWKAKGFEKYQTDKHSTHHYFIMYDLLFAPFQHKPVGVFEVRTNTGGSANLWDDYFSHPDTRIRSIDILDVPQSHRDYTSRLRLDIVDINKLTLVDALNIIENNGNNEIVYLNSNEIEKIKMKINELYSKTKELNINILVKDL